MVPEYGGPEGLQRRPVVEGQVDVVAEEGAEADAEHRGHEEQEEDVKFTLACRQKRSNIQLAQ